MEKIGVIGLGYVGLPLAVEFGKILDVVGFDINQLRIEELKNGYDRTLEVGKEELSAATKLSFASDPKELKHVNYFIVTVPTPVDEYKTPDLTPLIKASETVGKVLKKGDIVIYESTVYPGCTEEDCVPVLEKFSGLKFNIDFFCGYSPERINPGDRQHRLTNIKKVTSGSTPEIAEKVDQLYKKIIKAGTHKTSSIKVAEAAKVIENSQRDINIAFVNELSLIFEKMGIDTHEVLEAAGTKWNFLNYKPGLVGGHCIGVDPYYLTYKAQELGYHSQVINSGRYVNDSMGFYVAKQTVKKLIAMGKDIAKARVLIMGATFKEDVEDIRNSKVIDVVNEFKSYGVNVDVIDPNASRVEIKQEYGFELMDKPGTNYDAVMVSVNHKEYRSMTEEDFKKLCNEKAIIVDLKGLFRGKFKTLQYWSL